MKLDSAIFYTNNLKKAISFYKDIIGLEVENIEEIYNQFKQKGISFEKELVIV